MIKKTVSYEDMGRSFFKNNNKAEVFLRITTNWMWLPHHAKMAR